MIWSVSAFTFDYGKSKRFVVLKSRGMLRRFPIAFRREPGAAGVGPCSNTFICASAGHTRRNGGRFRKPQALNPLKRKRTIWMLWMRKTGRQADNATSRRAGAKRLPVNKPRLGLNRLAEFENAKSLIIHYLELTAAFFMGTDGFFPIRSMEESGGRQ